MEDTLRKLYTCYEEYLKNHTNISLENYSQGYYLNIARTSYEKGRIILYGQEPNGWDKGFDSYADGINDIINNRKKTRFFQKIQEIWEQNGLINNIAKFAKNTDGKHPPVSSQDHFWSQMYAPFEFNGKTATIYQHELDILKPAKILLLCGPGRKAAISAAFDFEPGFIDEYTPHLKNDEYAMKFEHENYKGITFMYTLHPQAHMDFETREKYNQKIEDFLNK